MKRKRSNTDDGTKKKKRKKYATKEGKRGSGIAEHIVKHVNDNPGVTRTEIVDHMENLRKNGVVYSKAGIYRNTVVCSINYLKRNGTIIQNLDGSYRSRTKEDESDKKIKLSKKTWLNELKEDEKQKEDEEGETKTKEEAKNMFTKKERSYLLGRILDINLKVFQYIKNSKES